MTRIFQANNPYNAFLLLIYGLLLKLPYLLHPTVPQPRPGDGVFFRYLLELLAPVGRAAPVVYALLPFLLLYLQAVSLNKIANDKRLYQRPHYLVGMSYLLLSTLFADWNVFSAPLLVNSLLIWIWSKSLALYNEQQPKTLLFNLGFAAGVASFIYFPAGYALLLVLAALLIARPIRLAEWLVTVLGFLAPYYFWLSALFLTDRWGSVPLPGLSLGVPRLMESYQMLAAVLLLIILWMIGWERILYQRRRQVVQIRKAWAVVIVYSLLALCFPFINPTKTFEYWVLIAPVGSLWAAGGFLYPKQRWLVGVLGWSLLILALVFSYVLR